MENGNITDSQITATSVSGNNFPRNARLNGRVAWCAGVFDRNQYIQVPWIIICFASAAVFTIIIVTKKTITIQCSTIKVKIYISVYKRKKVRKKFQCNTQEKISYKKYEH